MKKYIIILIIVIAIITTALVVRNYAWATDTGATSPGTMVDDDTVGTKIWADPDNAKTSNDSYANAIGFSVYATTHYLKATNFGFSVPSGATINGIIVEIEKKSTWSTVKDYEIKIVKADGSIGTINKANTETGWSKKEASFDYGAVDDLWGESWSNTDINDTDFGVVLSVKESDEGDSAYVDHIRITVYYTEAGGRQATQIKTGIKINAGKLIIK